MYISTPILSTQFTHATSYADMRRSDECPHWFGSYNSRDFFPSINNVTYLFCFIFLWPCGTTRASLLIPGVSRSQTMHQSVGLLCASDRLVPDNTLLTRQTSMLPVEFEPTFPGVRPLDHWGRHLFSITCATRISLTYTARKQQVTVKSYK